MPLSNRHINFQLLEYIKYKKSFITVSEQNRAFLMLKYVYVCVCVCVREREGGWEQEKYTSTLLTSSSFTRDQELINLSPRRLTMDELSRGPSRRVRPEPQHDWSSSAPQSNRWCTSLSSLSAASKASVKGR